MHVVSQLRHSTDRRFLLSRGPSTCVFRGLKLPSAMAVPASGIQVLMGCLLEVSPVDPRHHRNRVRAHQDLLRRPQSAETGESSRFHEASKRATSDSSHATGWFRQCMFGPTAVQTLSLGITLTSN